MVAPAKPEIIDLLAPAPKPEDAAPAAVVRTFPSVDAGASEELPERSSPGGDAAGSETSRRTSAARQEPPRQQFLKRMDERFAKKAIPASALDIVKLAAEEIAARIESQTPLRIIDIDDVLLQEFEDKVGPGAARAWTIEAMNEAMRDPWFERQTHLLPPSERREMLFEWAAVIADWSGASPHAHALRQMVVEGRQGSVSVDIEDTAPAAADMSAS